MHPMRWDELIVSSTRLGDAKRASGRRLQAERDFCHVPQSSSATATISLKTHLSCQRISLTISIDSCSASDTLSSSIPTKFPHPLTTRFDSHSLGCRYLCFHVCRHARPINAVTSSPFQHTSASSYNCPAKQEANPILYRHNNVVDTSSNNVRRRCLPACSRQPLTRSVLRMLTTFSRPPRYG